MVFSDELPSDDRNFVQQKVKKYGLQSQRKIPYFKSRGMLEENGYVLPERSKNCVFTNGGSESTKHWIIKCLIFKILRGRNREVGTEVEVKNAIVDVLDVTNMIAYEIETHLNKKRVAEKMKNFASVKDVFFVDTREVPDDLFEAEKYLQEKIV
jgi:hypothetical protein